MTPTSTSLRVLLVDDEPLARARLRSLLAACQTPAAQVVGELGRGSDLLAWLRDAGSDGGCDAVLLDIQMPGLDGLTLAAQLRAATGTGGAAMPPSVVFVTAHAEHALKAFELDAADYLTKPVRLERLKATLARIAQRRLSMAAGAASAHPAASGAAEATGASAVPAADVLIVNDRGRVVRVPVEDVLYLKAELKYVSLRTIDHTWLLDESLAELEPRLAGRFVRIHRNALVAVRAVRVLERHVVTGPASGAVAGDAAAADEATEAWAVHVPAVDEWLTVSRRQLASVREALGGR